MTVRFQSEPLFVFLRNLQLAGFPVEEADDARSLCVVLHEIVSGRHPLTGGGDALPRDRIQHQRLARDERSGVASASVSTVLGFTASTLTAPRSARPATAREFTEALDAAIAAQQ